MCRRSVSRRRICARSRLCARVIAIVCRSPPRATIVRCSAMATVCTRPHCSTPRSIRHALSLRELRSSRARCCSSERRLLWRARCARRARSRGRATALRSRSLRVRTAGLARRRSDNSTRSESTSNRHTTRRRLSIAGRRIGWCECCPCDVTATRTHAPRSS